MSPTFYWQLLRKYSFAKKLQCQTIGTKSCLKHFCKKKAAPKKLVKLTSVVNFIIILRVAFAPIFFCHKIYSQIVSREKDVENTFV